MYYFSQVTSISRFYSQANLQLFSNVELNYRARTQMANVRSREKQRKLLKREALLKGQFGWRNLIRQHTHNGSKMQHVRADHDQPRVLILNAATIVSRARSIRAKRRALMRTVHFLRWATPTHSTPNERH